LWLGATLAAPRVAEGVASIDADPSGVTLALMPSSAAERRQLDDWLGTFERQGRRQAIQTRTLSPDVYKAGFEARLREAGGWTDVHYWFAGLRLSELASKGLLKPLDELWQRDGLEASFGRALRDAVSWRGRPYAVPLNYYQWGFYYRKSTFVRCGLQAPRTWPEFLTFGERARAAGLAPTVTGARDAWTLAAWFDYLDLRLNGLDFHKALTAGRVSFLDDRVRSVFAAWQQLLDRHWYLAGALDLGWRETVPYLLRERAATMLMGNFFEQDVPGSLRDDLGFFPFPRLEPRLPRYEDAPVDVLVLAERSVRPRAALEFLSWAASPAPQAALAGAGEKVPANRSAALRDDGLVKVGARLLRDSAGLAQFFDRDTVREMAERGLGVFADFVAGKLDVEQALRALEGTRETLGSIA
jgi:multiple sugar transport system substrate-binding protein